MSMAIMRVHKTQNYTIMSNNHFKEKGMSLKAKGLLSMMLSLPDDWDYSVMGLVSLSKDGKDSVMGALRELEKFGYLRRSRITNEKGQFAGYDYDIYEAPMSDNPNEDNPYAENPNAGNPTQLNTKEINDEGIDELKNKNKKEINNDKRESSDLSTIDCGEPDDSIEPSVFTRFLIDHGYIKSDDLFLGMYNLIFRELIGKYSFQLVRSCLVYFSKRLVDGEAYDVNGNKVSSKFSYFKKSMEANCEMISKSDEENPYSLENIAKVLEMFGNKIS